MSKTEVHLDPGIDLLYSGQRGARVEVHTRNGTVFEEKVSVPLGEPENPLPLSATKRSSGPPRKVF